MKLHITLYYSIISIFITNIGYANLLRNSSFEESVSYSSTDETTNWFAWGGAKNNNWQTRSGNQALTIQGLWGGSNPAHGGIEQKCTVSPNTAYALNLYYWWDCGFTAATHKVKVIWYSVSAEISRTEFSLDMGNPELGWIQGGWHKFSIHDLKSPADCIQAEVQLSFEGIGENGSFYLEDVTFSDDVNTLLNTNIAVNAGNHYELQFDYQWDENYWAKSRTLEIDWLDSEDNILSTQAYPINLEGNHSIWHDSGTYPLCAPANAETARVQFITAIVTGAGNISFRDFRFVPTSIDYSELHNNSFEETLTGCSTGNWVTTGGFEILDWQQRHGKKALGFKGQWNAEMPTSGKAYQYVTVTPDTEYEFVCHHFWDNGFNATVKNITFSWYDNSGQYLGQTLRSLTCDTSSSIWTDSGAIDVVSMPSAASVKIAFDYSGVGASGTYYIDDVFFRKPDVFCRRDSTNLLDRTGSPFTIRGIAISGWFFPEAYMFGIYQDYQGHMNSYTQLRRCFEKNLGSSERAEAFWDVYTSNFLTEADIELLADKGVNTIRVPFNYRELSPENNTGAYDEKGFSKIDTLIEWCRKHDVYIILDMHSCPGGQAPVNSADPECIYVGVPGEWEGMQACLWQHDGDYNDRTGRTPDTNLKRTADLWRHIAKRYRNETQILGYELINEPYLDGSTDTNPPSFHDNSTNFNGDVIYHAFKTVSDAVREVDDRHIFYVEGDLYGEWIDGTMPPWDDNMGLAFHRYWKYNTNGCLDTYLNARIEHDLPLWLSESGENSNPWLREIQSAMETNNIGWTFWALKKLNTIATGFSGDKPDSFQYCIDNLWADSVDPDQYEAGLLDLVDALKTENCTERKGYFAIMFSDQFDKVNQPFTNHTIPGRINNVDYDIGDQGLAYFDQGKYRQNSFWVSVAYNKGYAYRNDAVDIYPSEEGCGYVVGSIEEGEWLKYTFNQLFPGHYDFNIHYLAVAGMQNPSFESGFDNWYYWGHSAVTNLNAQAGEWAACFLNRTSSANPNWAGFCQKQAVKEGYVYEISFPYYMPSTFSASKRDFVIEWFDDTYENRIGGITNTVGQTGLPSAWRTYGPVYVQVPPGVHYAELKFDFSGMPLNAGNFYVDNIMMTTTDECRQIRLILDDTESLTDTITLPQADAWTNATISNVAIPHTGIHTLKLEFVKSGISSLSALDISFNESDFVDGDGDKIDDHWEFAYGRNLDPLADIDTDGMNNQQEYIADTVPTNDASCLATLCNHNSQSNKIQVSLTESSVNRIYSVEYRESLLDGDWSRLITNVVGTGNAVLLVETNSINGFYRIKAALP